MSGIQELKEMIQSLPENDHIRLRKWFSERDWQKWDEQMYKDSATGRFDFLVREVEREKQKGTLKDL